MGETRPGAEYGAIEEFFDNGAAVERGTAVGVMRRSRPAGLEPADAILLRLVAVARRHGDTVPSLGATARQHGSTGLGLHAGAKAMRLGAVATVGLKSTLGHRTVLIRESLPYGQVLSIADSVQNRQSPPFRARPRRHSMRLPIQSLRTHIVPCELPSRNASSGESSASLIAPLHLHPVSVVKSQ